MNQNVSPAPNVSVTENSQNISNVPITLTFTSPGGASATGLGPVTTGDAGADFNSLIVNATGHDTLSTVLIVMTSPSLSVSTGSVTLTINNGPTNTSLISSPNPSFVGQSVTFTATVVPQYGTGTPTGTVTFYDGQTSLGTSPLVGGAAILSTSGLVATTNAHSITAIYNGDNSYTGSTSNTVSQQVNLISTTTSLISSANPLLFGQRVTFTATVTPQSGTGIPTGTVSFYDGQTWFGTIPLTNGVAALSTSSLVVSTIAHLITAHYNGDSTYNVSTSNAVSQQVNLTSTTTSLVSSANPSLVGQSVTFTATVTPLRRSMTRPVRPTAVTRSLLNCN